MTPLAPLTPLAALPPLAPLIMTRAEHVIYFGTPDVAVGPLREIVAAGFCVDLVITGSDKRRGRGSQTSPSPVKQAALDLGLAISHNLEDAVGVASTLKTGVVGVVVAYGHIIPASVLRKIPMINVHYSLLPRWRGAAPVERAVLAGDEQTGVCIMRVVEQLDAGDVLASASTPISSIDTVASLRQRLELLATPLLIDVLTNGANTGLPQHGDIAVAVKITTADLTIDWLQAATVIDRQVRVGGAFTLLNNKRFKIHSLKISEIQHRADAGSIVVVGDRVLVVCGDGIVELCDVQPQGKSRVSAADWSKGARLDTTSRFGS